MAKEPREDLTPEEVMARVKSKAELAQVLDRGLTVERLSVGHLLPPDRVGIFVRDRQASISRYRALGFRVEKLPPEVIADVNAHDSADGTYRVGDVILMSAPKAQYDAIQELYAERGAGKLEQSRRDFRANMQREGVVPILDREVD